MVGIGVIRAIEDGMSYWEHMRHGKSSSVHTQVLNILDAGMPREQDMVPVL